jgi:ASCH domain
VSRLALSLKQPWAALLVAGRKSIEVRRWTTPYRGELLIHAARVDDERPEAWAHVDDEIRALAELRGGIIGVGTLAEVRVYRALAGFVADRALHLNESEWFEAGGLFGLRFEGLRTVPFCRVPGFFKLFEVDVEIEVANAAPVEQAALPAPETQARLPVLRQEGLLAAVKRRFNRLKQSLGRASSEGE